VADPLFNERERHIALDSLYTKKWRKPFGMAGMPVMPAEAMTAFTWRHAVVRLNREIRSFADRGSCCALGCEVLTKLVPSRRMFI
jgi:hypothetical protein